MERDPLKGPAAMPRPNFFHTMSLGLLVFMPTAIFSTLALLFTFVYHGLPALVWLVVAFCLAVSALFMLVRNTRNSPPYWFNLGCLCVFAIGASTGASLINYRNTMTHYWAYEGQRDYTNVRPTEPALSHLDAGKVVFSDDSRLDFSKFTAYKHDGETYCVAPIVGEGQTGAIQFWAAGTDCCSRGGNFTCDDAGDQNAHSGLVFLASYEFGSSPLQHFRKAAQQADTTHGLESSPDALFVRWVADAAAAQDSYWNYGVAWLVGSVIVYFLLSIFAGFLLHFGHRRLQGKDVK